MSLVQAVAVHPQIAAALHNASARTGTDFDYLLDTAMRESSLDPSAKSSTSSAQGLFQFTRQTWLETLKQNGESLGLGQYANAITQDQAGRYVVADPAARREILALRNDPEASALMAAAYTNASKDRLEAKLGRSVSPGELYVAHFMGAGGATKLISSAEDTPNARADLLFGEAAAANRSIFYDASGRPKTVAEVYRNLVARHQDGASPRFEVAELPATDEADTIAADEASALRALAGAFAEPSAGARATARPVAEARTDMGGGIAGRSPLKLSSAVLNVLASLDLPAGGKTETSSEADDARKSARRTLLPRSGFAYA